ncbi:MAG: alpha/beta hydrolase [Bacilli bacterium]|nr:alpha/beta hydrolase [Bacilli bacterium]
MYKVNNVNINYINYGNKEGKDIVFLHGWGQNIQMMKMLADPLSKENNIVIVDLPGFGESTEPTYDWMVDDYVEAIKSLLESLKIKKPILVGHSFGGKISLLYSSKYEVEKLVVLGSPYKKEIEKLSLKTKMLKAAKKVPVLNKLEGFAKKHIGSTDYRNASEIMRKILVNTVNYDISSNLSKIKCPTLIIWGTNDEAVPIEDAYELEKIIKDAAVIEYEGCSHYAYLERLNQTVNVLRSFIGGND